MLQSVDDCVSSLKKNNSNNISQQFLEIQGAKHPLGGVGQPDDVANTIAFLASDMARFITGQLVFVDGGRHCISAGLTTKVK